MQKYNSIDIFISYSHHDKVFARRLLRELGARGFHVWLDERELPVGAELTNTIRGHIEAADLVLVVASTASAESTWVSLELEHARTHRRPIVPFFVEPVADRDPFRDHKGIDVPLPQEFGRAVLALMEGVMQAFDRELPPIDPTLLETGLRELASEELALEPLIIGCLDGEGLHGQNVNSVCMASFYTLDYALNALLELRPTESQAWVTARCFAIAGAGFDALLRWIERSSDGGGALVGAVGTRLKSTLLAPALKLLGECSLPNNHALYSFIDHNADQLSVSMRHTVLRLVTWPPRGPDRMADTLARVALAYFPDADHVRDMWKYWIFDGKFDGDPRNPGQLAREFHIAQEQNLQGWAPVYDALQTHVHELLHDPSRERVWTAIDHLIANAEEHTPLADRLANEIDRATASAEWQNWAQQDPQSAEEMLWHASMHAAEARGDHNWLNAMKKAEAMIVFDKRRKTEKVASNKDI